MQISWDHSAAQRVRSNPHKRLISLGLIGAIHLAAVYALINGFVPGVHAIVPGPTTLIPDVTQPTPPKQQPPTHVENTFVDPTMPTRRAPDFDLQRDTGGTITVLRGNEDTGTKPTKYPPTAAQGIAATHTIPPYPALAIRLAQQGTVTLRLAIAPDGTVSGAQVETSSGSALLDDAAVMWVKEHWRYEPATENGAAVAGTMLAAVRFDLKNAR